jgi:hypothetical protein
MDDWENELLANVFESSDYIGSTDYATQEEFLADNPEYELLAQPWMGEFANFYDQAMDDLVDYGEEMGWDLEVSYFDDFNSMDEILGYLEPLMENDQFDYWTQPIQSWLDIHADQIAAWEEGQWHSEYWDWKDDFGKYFTAYDKTKEELVSEMTNESIGKLADEYGKMNQVIASKTGKFNLESGRANDLWTGLKDNLSRKINLEEIEEDLEIRGLRDRYERGFYNQALEVGRATPLFLNPDYEPDN